MAKTWLEDSEQLDLAHPRLRITAQKLTQMRHGDAERAAALHDFVRRMPFAATADPCAPTAAEVLQRRAGDCHAKGLLFTALCRAAGLPARLLFLRVRSRFLAGVLEGGPASMVHAVGQVQVEGRWVSTDGYVVDPLLFARAKQMLRASGLDCGWGIVREAGGQWDGRSPCLQQFRGGDVLATLGVYDDVRQFSHVLAGAAGEQAPALAYALGARLLNWRVARLRRTARTPLGRAITH